MQSGASRNRTVHFLVVLRFYLIYQDIIVAVAPDAMNIGNRRKGIRIELSIPAFVGENSPRTNMTNIPPFSAPPSSY